MQRFVFEGMQTRLHTQATCLRGAADLSDF
jgi:hypothetical protein